MLSGSEEGYFEGTDEVALPQDTEITGHTPAAKSGGVRIARLTIIEGEGKMTSYDIRKEVTIGRASSNMIVLKEAKVSRQHAIVKKQGDEFLSRTSTAATVSSSTTTFKGIA
jgi:pSer/pThr/pTyr-binding forkhead associated (FHA) protein